MDPRWGKSRALLLLSWLTITIMPRLAFCEADGSNNRQSSILGSGENSEDRPDRPLLETAFPLPLGYNKLRAPSINGSQIFVNMHFSVMGITDIDEVQGFVDFDTKLAIQWLDWHIWNHLLQDTEAQTRLLSESSGGVFGIDSEFLHSIWKPDVTIMELDSVHTAYLLSKQMSLFILVGEPESYGTVEVNSRQTFRVHCEMDFTYYPADTQKCEINIMSYTYSDAELAVSWRGDQGIYLGVTSDPNFDFQISDVEPGNEMYALTTLYQPPGREPMNFSTISFTIQLRRNLIYHVVQTFLPSVILILITWLCFLLPQDMIEARIGISMTTLLTIIAMFSAVREQAPKVSYSMAIDFWMVFCIHMIFLALVVFTVMYWMRTKFGKPVVEDLEREAEGPTPAVAGGHHHPGIRFNLHAPEAAAAWMKKFAAVKYGWFVSFATRYAFPLFASIFLIFMAVFVFWLLTASEYFSWDPSPKYNAIPLEGEGDEGVSRSIVVRHGLPYSGNMTGDGARAEEAEDRLAGLIKGTMCSTIKALRPDHTCESE